MQSRRDLLKMGAIAGAAVALPWKFTGPAAVAISQPLQTPLPGPAIQQFVDPLPLLSLAGGPMETILAGTEEIALMIREFKAGVMPSGFAPENGLPYAGTWVWGYRMGHGWVWHCHILDHEDNEMMRPYRATAKAGQCAPTSRERTTERSGPRSAFIRQAR